MHHKYSPEEMQCVIVLSKHEGEKLTLFMLMEILLLTSRIQNFTVLKL